MKLSLIIPSFYPATVYGGPIFSTLHTCQALVKLEDVYVRVSTTNTNMIARLEVAPNMWIKFENNFYVKYYNETVIGKFSLSLFINIWRDIKTADIVHIQGIFNTPIPISLLYARLLKKPIILSPRGTFGEWCLGNGSRFKAKWLKWIIKPFAYYVTWHATAEQEKHEIQVIFPDAKVEVIPNGIEYDMYQNTHVFSSMEYMKKYTKKKMEAEKIVVSMGRIQKKKGFDILIDSFVQVLEQYPKAKLLIAGQDEGEEKNLLKQIESLRLDDKVFLIGAINGQEKINFLANADLFVLPSHNENFGNVYVESLAAGTPIVASTETPWKEVESANCGKWVNNSVKETSAAILKMLEEEREIMRVNAKKLATKYDWENIALQFKKMFDDMVGK